MQQEIERERYPQVDSKPTVLKGHSGATQCVTFSPNDQILASGSSDASIRLWNAQSGVHIATLRGHSIEVRSVAFSPDGTTLASASWDGAIKLWDLESRTEISTLEGHSSEVYSIAFSPDGTRLASGSGDKTIRLWDVKSRTSASILKGHSDLVRSVVFSPDGKQIFSGCQDTTSRLWDVGSGTTLTTLTGHSAQVISTAFSPNGQHLATGSDDDTVRLWNATTGAHLATKKGNFSCVHSVSFSPDSRYLAAGSYDAAIRLWDVASGSLVSTLRGHSKHVLSVAFSPNGARLASGSGDRTARIWRIGPEDIGDSQVAVITTDSVGSTQSTARSQQITTTSLSTLIQLRNDITGSISLQDSPRFSCGGYGELFLGVHSNYGKVALKRPFKQRDEASIRRFIREADLWRSISHPYILPCLGTCKVGPDVYVVSPFIENGDVFSWMTKGKDLNHKRLLFEVAEALTHLHHKGIVHGDLKAQNILLGDDGSALLCDFGLAKVFDTMATSTELQGVGSVRWMAPELFLGESKSTASDVYAFGITIAEVLSGQVPYHNLPQPLAVMFYVMNSDGRPPTVPLTSTEGSSYAMLWEIAEKCWVKDVKARLNMAQVLGIISPLNH